jgi:hypothetical protein
MLLKKSVKNTLMLVVVLVALVIIGKIIYDKYQVSEKKEEFSQYEKTATLVKEKRAQLTSVDNESIQGSGSVIKTLNKNGDLRIYIEANLPLADGGDFNNETIIYNVWGGNDELKNLMYLERDNDGFYRAEYIIEDSSSEDFNNLSVIVISADDEKKRTPIIKGTL